MDESRFTERSGRKLRPYMRIEQDLRSRIARGEWPVGSLLPSRTQLAEQYGVALNTVQRAIAALLDEAILRAEDKRGTFVAKLTSNIASSESASYGFPTAPSSLAYPSPVPVPSMRRPRVALLSATIESEFQGYDQKDPWMRILMYALEQSLAAGGVQSAFFNAYPPVGEPTRPFEEILTEALNTEPDALIVINIVGYRGWMKVIEAETKLRQLPTLLIWDRTIRTPYPHVFHDQWAEGYMAAQHLCQQGYKQVLFLTPFDSEWLEQRVLGARLALQHHLGNEATLQTYPLRPPMDDYTFLGRTEEIPDAMTHYLEEALASLQFTAASESLGIIVPNDDLAAIVHTYLAKHGYALGTHVGVIGFDNHIPARALGLTTVAPPLQLLGETAAQLMLRLLRNETIPLSTVLSSHLIPRESTARG